MTSVRSQFGNGENGLVVVVPFSDLETPKPKFIIYYMPEREKINPKQLNKRNISTRSPKQVYLYRL